MQFAKRGQASLTVCSTAFVGLGKAQARALGFPELPIAVIPHPFGSRTRDEIRELANQCVQDIARLVAGADTGSRDSAGTGRNSGAAADPGGGPPSARATFVEAPDDLEELNAFFRERRWTDGMPVIPPTPGRVQRMLEHTGRRPDEVVATLAPGFGAATVEKIAVNAVLAGCDPAHLPVLIAAVEAIASPEFNLQGIQCTTNAVAVWLIVNGPVAEKLQVNGGLNCLGQGASANATLGRALHLVMQNVGRAVPGEMDRATQGQPGKYSLCCAENEAASPWPALHLDRGFAADESTVTVAGIAGTINMNTHAKDAADVLRVIADTMAHAPSNDYWAGGEPWIMLSPEHADILQREGLSKADVQRALWEQSKMPARRMAARDFARTQQARRDELGEIGPDTLLPISRRPEDIGIVVAGGPGTHSVYLPSFGDTHSVTRAIQGRRT